MGLAEGGGSNIFRYLSSSVGKQGQVQEEIKLSKWIANEHGGFQIKTKLWKIEMFPEKYQISLASFPQNKADSLKLDMRRRLEVMMKIIICF